MSLSARLRPLEIDLARASTLPAFTYTDPEILELERAAIFRRTWQPIGRASEVDPPGSFMTTTLDRAPLVVTRDTDGTLRGFYNVCRHRAGPVAIGNGHRRALSCKYHGWTYALDGRLITTPELGDIVDFDKACHGLKSIKVETFGPIVFANLDPDAPPLATILGDIPRETASYRMEAMRLVHEKTYELDCNWKVYVDNFLEGYHLPTVHPSLFRELDYDAYRVDTFDLYSKQLAPIRPKSQGTRQYAPTAAGAAEALYYWVFPNWMLNIYPDNMSLNIVVPLGAGRTATVFEWYRHPERAAPEEVARTVAFSDEIQIEDIAICEAVQRGLASGAYETGRFSTARENGVHHFQKLVVEQLLRESNR